MTSIRSKKINSRIPKFGDARKCYAPINLNSIMGLIMKYQKMFLTRNFCKVFSFAALIFTLGTNSHASPKEDGYVCYMYGFNVNYQTNTIYHTPIQSYLAPTKCPKGSDFVHAKSKSWLEHLERDSKIDLRATRNHSYTYCECTRPEPNSSIAPAKAKQFVIQSLDDEIRRHKPATYTYINVDDFSVK